MRGGFMKKLIALTAFIIFFNSCGGGTIGDAQNFEPNEPPAIVDFTVVSVDGSPTDALKAGMKFTITVKAKDPENKKLKFQFNSDYGYFGNPVNTDDSCSISFVTGSFVRPGLPVTVDVSVIDHRDASAVTNYEIGKGRRGPTVTIKYIGSAYIQKEKNTQISFKANCEGIYQLYCDNGVDESSADLRPALAYFLYRKDENGNFKDIIVDIKGPASTADAKVQLSTLESVNKVWVVFSDGINDPFAALAPVTVDNTPPQFTKITPSGTNCGVRSEINIIFDEPVFYKSGSIAVSNSFTGPSSDDFTPSSTGASVILKPKYDMKHYETYTVSIDKNDVEIIDRAGNKYTGTNSGSFSTQAIGQLAKPEFRNTDNSAVNSSAPYEYVEGGKTIKAVYTGSETRTSVVITSSKLTEDPPSAPPTDYSKNPTETFMFEENMQLKAVAFKRGYEPSPVGSINVKVITPLNGDLVRISTDGTGTVSTIGNTKIYSGSNIKFSKNTANYGALYTAFKWAFTDNANPTNPTSLSTIDYSTPYSTNLHNRYVWFKFIIQKENMEPRTYVQTAPYIIRKATLPFSSFETISNGLESNYSPLNYQCVNVSPNGNYIVYAAENGFIYKGQKTGTNSWVWTELTASGQMKWRSLAVSDNGNVIMACADGDDKLYLSTDGGVSFSEISASAYPSVSQRKWTGVAMSADGKTRAAVCESYHSGGMLKGKVCYYSPNPFPMWQQHSDNKNYSSIAMSKDGAFAMAVSNDDSEASDLFTGTFNVNGHYSNSLKNSTIADYTQTPPRFVSAGLVQNETMGKLWYFKNSGENERFNIPDSEEEVFTPFSAAISWNNTAYFSGQYGLTFKTYYSSNYSIAQPGNPTWNETMNSIPIRGISSSRNFATSDFLSAVGSYEFLRTGREDTWVEHPNSGSHDWIDISIAAGNNNIIYAAATCKAGSESYLADEDKRDYIYRSLDGGDTWTKCSQFERRVWRSVYVNNDGSIVAAASAPDGIDDNGAIYLSKNGAAPIKYKDFISYKSVQMSDDGLTMVASSYGNYCHKGKFPYSTSDWSDYDAGNESKQTRIAADAQKCAFLYEKRLLVLKANGVTFLDKSYADSYNTLCMTRDARTIVVSGTGQILIYNLNSDGTNYVETPKFIPFSTSNIVCSDITPDGKIIVLGEEYGSIYVSYDGGSNFVAIYEGSSDGTRKRYWSSLALSNDGFTVFATVKNQRGIVRLR